MSTLLLKVPALGESITEATIGKWKRGEGEVVKEDEPLVEVESDKATVEVPSPGSGVLRKILRQAGDTVPIGEVIAEIEPGAEAQARPAAPAPAPAAPPPRPVAEVSAAPAAVAAPAVNGASVHNGDPQGPKGSPAVRRMMAEKELAPSDVRPTGPAGRIEREDVERALQAHKSPPASKPAPISAPPAGPAPSGGRKERTVPMTPLRKTVARRLLEAQNNAAILTTFNEINMAADPVEPG